MNSHVGNRQAVDDYFTVQSKLTSVDTELLRAKILSGTATDEEIEEHYRTFDTVEHPQALVIAGLEKDFSKVIETHKSIAMADFIGGLAILNSVFFYDLETRDGSTTDFLVGFDDYTPPKPADELDIQRLQLASLYVARTRNSFMKRLTERAGLMHFAYLEGLFDDSIVSDPKKLRRVYMGNAILREGINSWVSMEHIEPSDMTEADTHMMRENVIMGLGTVVTMSHLILKSGLYTPSIESKEIAAGELKACQGNALSWSTNQTDEHYKESGELAFLDVCDWLENIADYARAVDITMLQKGRIKGVLHEVLWMLDAYAIRKGVPEKYGHLTVTAATEALDMPFGGNPVLKRGFDFTITNGDGTQEGRRLIQTGASRRKIKNKTEHGYHPDIEYALEQEFNEVNVPTLEKKVAAYRAWADAKFSEEAFAKLKIYDKILGSVKDIFSR